MPPAPHAEAVCCGASKGSTENQNWVLLAPYSPWGLTGNLITKTKITGRDPEEATHARRTGAPFVPLAPFPYGTSRGQFLGMICGRCNRNGSLTSFNEGTLLNWASSSSERALVERRRNREALEVGSPWNHLTRGSWGWSNTTENVPEIHKSAHKEGVNLCCIPCIEGTNAGLRWCQMIENFPAFYLTVWAPFQSGKSRS